jgi:hypothetical protein
MHCGEGIGYGHTGLSPQFGAKGKDGTECLPEYVKESFEIKLDTSCFISSKRLCDSSLLSSTNITL